MGVEAGKRWGVEKRRVPGMGDRKQAHASIPPVWGPVEMLAKRRMGRHAQKRRQNEAKVGREWEKKHPNRPMRCGGNDLPDE